MTRLPAPRRLLAWLVGVAAMSPACTTTGPVPTTPVTPAPRIEGWLQVDGQRLVDGRGREVRLLGLGIKGMGVGSGKREGDDGISTGWEIPSPGTYDNVARWGFNSVRLTISWANLEPRRPTRNPDGSYTHHYNEEYLQAIDDIVGNFSRRDVAVLICMSQHKWSPAFRTPSKSGSGGKPGAGMPAWLYPAPAYTRVFEGKRAFFSDVGHSWEWFAEAWKEVAGRYAGDPKVVGLDVLNEPYWGTKLLPSPEHLHLDELYRYVGTEIREVNADALLIFEDSQDRPGAGLAMTASPPVPNAVYSFHLYTETWDPEGLRRTERFLTRARRWGVPVWIGEFNRFGPSARPLPVWREHLSEMMSYTRRHGISWSYWGYGGVDRVASKEDEVANSELLRLLQSGF